MSQSLPSTGRVFISTLILYNSNVFSSISYLEEMLSFILILREMFFIQHCAEGYTVFSNVFSSSSDLGKCLSNRVELRGAVMFFLRSHT